MPDLLNLSRRQWGRFFLFAGPVFFMAVVLPSTLHAQFKFREPPNRQNPQALEQREGMFIWQQFLRNRGMGSFRIEGTLVYRPANAPSGSYALELSGTWLADFERTRVSLTGKDGRTWQRDILVEDGSTFLLPAEASATTEPLALNENDLGQRLFEDLPFTWSDLLMPYLHWKDVAYIGPDRYLGRPAHRFSLANPDEEGLPAKVVVTLDEDYAALLKADFRDRGDKLVKRLRVGGFKQFGSEWMFSELSWSDRETRESVSLKVESFGVGMDP